MQNLCPRNEHLGRRAFLKGALATGGGLAVANWGGLFHSQLSRRRDRRRPASAASCCG